MRRRAAVPPQRPDRIGTPTWMSQVELMPINLPGE